MRTFAQYLSNVFPASVLGSTFLSVLFLGTAFTVSLLWAIGPEMLPLVDKGHLLVLLAFYTSALTVVLRFAKGNYDLYRASAADAVENSIASSLKAKIEARVHHHSYSSDEIAALATRVARRGRRARWPYRLLLWIPVAGLSGAWAWSIRDELLKVATVPGVISWA